MIKSFKTLAELDDVKKHILRVVQKNGPMTKSQLSLMTNLKTTTLNRFMKPLEEIGLIVEVDLGESSGGRKPVLYDVNPGKYYCIGVDISRTYTRAVIVNLKMKILACVEFPMTEENTPQRTIKDISRCIEKMKSLLSIENQDILGVGVGAVGPMDRLQGIITGARNFRAPGWSNVPLREMLERELSLPVMVDNGANGAVLAELHFGSGKGLENIAYFNCGIGIRTGAVSGRNLVRTINDAEDVFGHMIIDVDGEQCSCGNYGCIDCYSSINSMVKKFISLLKRGRVTSVPHSEDGVDYRAICSGAEDGDPLAVEVITNAASILGAGLANYMSLLNPQMVILSGPLIKHSDLFYRVSTEVARRKLYLGKNNRIIFNRGGYFKDNAMAVGAAVLFIEQILS